uniref:Ig-like domain-containing protein n=1 Tax=Denticeps clupeoides TaxID=299321 RepID=A0AAY3ZX03_9TELE
MLWICLHTDRPMPVVTLTPTETQIFSGQSVSLTCDILSGKPQDWKYSWFKKGYLAYNQVSSEQEYRISPANESHSGDYTCRGTRKSDSQNSRTSEAINLPIPELTVDPQGPVFTGETVTLKCGLATSGGWRYKWYKGSSQTEVSQSDHYHRAGDTLTITLPVATLTIEPQSLVFTGEMVTLKCVVESFSDWRYKWYKGRSHTEVPQSDRYSRAGSTLTIRGAADCNESLPNPKLSSDRAEQVFTGSSVTLSCEANLSAGWEFYWYRHTPNSDPVGQTAVNSYTISSIKVSDGGQYWCSAGRGNPVFYTHYSNAVWVKVTGSSPAASVVISPNRSQHFTYSTFSLSCDVQDNSSGWRLRWFTGREWLECPSSWSSEMGHTCTISYPYTSDSGVYWCQSDSRATSLAINVTVHDGDVILESPAQPVIEGNPLTLRCMHRSEPTSLSADFYKDGLRLQTQSTGHMTIPAVSKIHEGLYHCRSPDRGTSPKSWVSVRPRGNEEA